VDFFTISLEKLFLFTPKKQNKKKNKIDVLTEGQWLPGCILLNRLFHTRVEGCILKFSVDNFKNDSN
jgi:hypothetical protein